MFVLLAFFHWYFAILLHELPCNISNTFFFFFRYVPRNINLCQIYFNIVWGRALAPRVSSITKTQLQRRRATASDPTECKEKPWNIGKGAQTSLLTTHFCLPSTVWQWRVTCYYRMSQLDIEIRQNIPCYVFSSTWLCASALKWALKTWCWWGCCRLEPRISQWVLDSILN